MKTYREILNEEETLAPELIKKIVKLAGYADKGDQVVPRVVKKTKFSHQVMLDVKDRPLSTWGYFWYNTKTKELKKEKGRKKVLIGKVM